MYNNILTKTPIAHRGIHNNSGDAPENSMLAFKNAIDAGFAIECDVKLTKDGKVIVFHDDDFRRLCHNDGAVEAVEYNEIRKYSILNSRQHVPLLNELLELVSGKVPLIVEIKSFDKKSLHTDYKLEAAVLDTIRNYHGPLGLKSFNPFTVEFLKQQICPFPVGFLSCNYEDDEDLKNLALHHAHALTHLTANAAIIADFISYSIDDLTEEISNLCRSKNKPLMVWTVRTLEQLKKAQKLADNIVFEGSFIKHDWKM